MDMRKLFSVLEPVDIDILRAELQMYDARNRVLEIELTEEERALCSGPSRLVAIKKVKDRTGCNLRSAKSAVDKFKETIPRCIHTNCMATADYPTEYCSHHAKEKED